MLLGVGGEDGEDGVEHDEAAGVFASERGFPAATGAHTVVFPVAFNSSACASSARPAFDAFWRSKYAQMKLQGQSDATHEFRTHTNVYHRNNTKNNWVATHTSDNVQIKGAITDDHDQRSGRPCRAGAAGQSDRHTHTRDAPSHLHQFVKVNPGVDIHAVQHVHDVLSGHVARSALGVWTPTQPSN